MRFYKIKISFDPSEDILIDETELDKALYAHMSGKTAMFNGGSISGNHIISVLPDFHRGMGWNHTYKIQPEDQKHIDKKCIGYREGIQEAKVRISEHMKNGTTNLIGENIPKLSTPLELTDKKKGVS